MPLQPSDSLPKLPPLGVDFQKPELLKALVSAHRHLAERKGCAASIPNQAILINTLALQEAKASSEVEGYVTTQDELFQADLHIAEWVSPAAKEVSRYREALRHGFDRMREQQGILGNGTLIALFQLLKNSGETFRTNGGTVLKNEKTGATVFVPPQDSSQVQAHMQALEPFINDDLASDLDPIIKMALIHHQFESIHPFSDGNGRIGRVLCVLYLVRTGLLDTPVRYLSRYINQHKGDYYRLLQEVRGAEGDPAASAASMAGMGRLHPQRRRPDGAPSGATGGRHARPDGRNQAPHADRYPQAVFAGPAQQPVSPPLHTHQVRAERPGITRQTAARYLRQLAQAGLVQEHSQGKHLYFINAPLVELLVRGERG